MVPRRNIKLPDLQNTPVFIGAGTNDLMCPAEETEELDELLTAAGANVSVHWESHGHQLTTSEIQAAKSWYKKLSGF